MNWWMWATIVLYLWSGFSHRTMFTARSLELGYEVDPKRMDLVVLIWLPLTISACITAAIQIIRLRREKQEGQS